MPKHPSDGCLRRLLDEPVAVAVADEEHAGRCPRCRARMGSMREDQAVVDLALGGEATDFTPAPAALLRLRAAAARPAETSLLLPPAKPRRAGGRRRRRFVRPATVVGSLLVLTGGATAAAATHLVPIFQPESVAPLSVPAGDLANLNDLAQFGTLSGAGKLDVTPEASVVALSSAAGFTAPQVQPPGSVSAAASYWLIGPDYAQVTISVARVDAAAAAAGETAPPAPPGVDGSELRVSTGNAVVEVWGALGDLTTQGTGQRSSGSPGLSLVHRSSASSPGGGSAGAPPSTGAGGTPVGEALPQLAVAVVQGPTVASSGVSLATLEGYLLAQPELSAQLAAEIKAIGSPGSTLPVPVPAEGSSQTLTLDGHPAVVTSLGAGGHLVVWAANGQVSAVLGTLPTDQLIAVAGQVA